jgi:hypothetical protein
MSIKSNVVNIKSSAVSGQNNRLVQLESGRQVVIQSEGMEEVVRIVEPEGNISLTVRMTDKGPVVTLTGAHLEISSTESITLDSRNIVLNSRENTLLKSEGGLRIDAEGEVDIHSEDDIRVEAKIIHLN